MSGYAILKDESLKDESLFDLKNQGSQRYTLV